MASLRKPKLRGPVYWHQGLFLQPQHLQNQERRVDELFDNLLISRDSFPWGLIALDVNKKALASGTVEVRDCRAIFRDGTYVNYPHNARLLSRNVENVWLEKNKPLIVYLALPLEQSRDMNITVLGQMNESENYSTRFIVTAEGEESCDIYDSENSTSIQQVEFNLRIIFETERKDFDDLQMLPLMRLVQDGSEIDIDKTFIPPSVTSSATSAIHHHLDALKNNLVGRLSMLQNHEGSLGADSAASNLVAVRNRLAMQTLARHISRLQCISIQTALAPIEVYSQLRELASELSLFSDQYSVTGDSKIRNRESIQTYLHDNLSLSFSSVMDAITQMLNALSLGPELMINLDKVDIGRFVGTLNQEFYDHRHAVYLVIRSSSRLKDDISHFMDFCKLGAPGQVEVYAKRALPGLGVFPLEGKPLGVSDLANARYYNIDRNGHEWTYVEESGQISLIWDQAPDDLIVDILVVRA